MPRTRPAAVATALLVAALTFSVTPTEVTAQTYAVTVWTQLNTLYERFNQNGYSSRNYIIGRLKGDESERWNVTLHGGNTYVITGACDADCKDIDLQLLDANGKVLVEDVSSDDIPMMSYAIRTTGVYSIRATMYQCKDTLCYYGLGIFFK